ncbi:transcriptional repressor general negative regulator of transcription subunit 4 [Diatrype stigma]|uniref:DNA 3'-5' helicase n=1 Tax=Diatrype stigma TaxID=117547 RepID=A0AAN9UZP5_9PEZI
MSSPSSSHDPAPNLAWVKQNELLGSPTREQVRTVIDRLSESQSSAGEAGKIFLERCKWIVEHTADRVNTQQVFIASVIRTITGAEEARDGQVEAVRRLVYLKSDTVLIAATGYGKSAVLQAFTAITGLITIQIVPLTKLGETQVDSIKKEVPGSTPVFVDSDTFLKEYILQHAGFGADVNIIRTSVDRPEISLVVQPLLRGSIRDYRRLEFLFEDASPQATRAIPKTVIYVDSKPQLLAVRFHLINHLVSKYGFSKPAAREVIMRYDADVRPVDKDRIFDQFSQENSAGRVMLATISFGMGLNIPDIRRIVQFNLPPNTSLSDIWQRVGRAMRKQTGQGIAYIFAPYWAFDNLGTSESVPKTPRPKPRRRQTQAQLVQARLAHVPRISSGLREMTLAERDGDDDAASQASDVSQADSLASHDSAAEQRDDPRLTLSEASQNLFEIDNKVKWSKQDEANRSKLSPAVSAFLNSSCFRKSILEYLQEPVDDPDLEYKRPVETIHCCNACNNDLGRIPSLEPRTKASSNKPQAGSFSGVALCKDQAQSLAPNVRHDLIGELFLDSKLQYAIAKQFSSRKQYLPFSNVNGLVEKVPELSTWEYLDEHGPALVNFCIQSTLTVRQRWEAKKEEMRQKREARKQAASSSSLVPASRRATSEDASPSATRIRQA